MHRELLDVLSTGWIENALGVSRATVAAWRRGKFPESRRLQLTEAVLAVIADTTKTPPPEWAEEMEQRLTETLLANREIFVQTITEQAVRYGVEQTLGPQPPAEPAPDKQGPQRKRAVRR